MKWNPHVYQKRAVRWLIERDAALLWLDPGLGKTAITLAAIKILKKKKLLNGPALVVAPARVCDEVWRQEAEKWDDFDDLTVAVIHGPEKEMLLRNSADVYVVSYEGLDWLLGTTERMSRGGKKIYSVNWDRWRSLGFDVLVMDEVSKVKNTRSKRFKLLKDVLRTFRWRWGLTGSPASNGLIDLFGQVYAVDLGRTFGPYITHFRNQYFVPAFDGFNWILKEDGERKIHAAVAPVALRMSSEEYLTLPPLVNVDTMVTLNPRAYKIYRELERDLIAEIEDGTVTAVNAAAASSKCRQVASGAVYDAAGEVRNVHDAKIMALTDLLEELNGRPLLVAYQWHHDVDKIRTALARGLGDRFAVLPAPSPRETSNTIRRWNAGQITLLVGHPASIGHGLNLQGGGCEHVCWYSLTWDLEHYQQLISRIWRQGTTADRVLVHHLIARNTLDEVVLQTIRGKDVSQRALFDAVRKIGRR